MTTIDIDSSLYKSRRPRTRVPTTIFNHPKQSIVRIILVIVPITLLLMYYLRSHKIQKHKFYIEKDSKYDHMAIAVKTGVQIAHTRVPIQLLTFLAPIKNILLIGEAEEHKRSLDEIVPDESADGWKADAHKNIPGFGRLFEYYPDANWYIMIDDDTYMFMNNLHDFLLRLDHTKPYYLGAANVFKGCDGVTEFGKGPYFAHGGSGIILSKQALKQMMTIADVCIERYRSCWAGDVRLGLCLRDAGVLLKDPGGLFKSPPNDRLNFNNTCLRPKTFHHLLTHQIQQLYEIEKAYRPIPNRFITMMDVFQTMAEEREWPDGDRLGGDYLDKRSADVGECKQFCLDDSRCVSYTFRNHKCYLKESAHPLVYIIGATNGIIKKHFICRK